uniref:Protein kinase domain-containing protein n=1 Tax=Oryza barthii TaxID=65489 RepID=A0A0D3EIJ7_9ORYZ
MANCRNLKLTGGVPARSDGDSGGLSWERRFMVAVATARALAYLHHDCKPQVLHLNIKSRSILLDKEHEAKLLDLGLAKLLLEPSNLPDYIAPELASSSSPSSRHGGDKCDMFSFGVVLIAGYGDGAEAGEQPPWTTGHGGGGGGPARLREGDGGEQHSLRLLRPEHEESRRGKSFQVSAGGVGPAGYAVEGCRRVAVVEGGGGGLLRVDPAKEARGAADGHSSPKGLRPTGGAQAGGRYGTTMPVPATPSTSPPWKEYAPAAPGVVPLKQPSSQAAPAGVVPVQPSSSATAATKKRKMIEE